MELGVRVSKQDERVVVVNHWLRVNVSIKRPIGEKEFFGSEFGDVLDQFERDAVWVFGCPLFLGKYHGRHFFYRFEKVVDESK